MIKYSKIETHNLVPKICNENCLVDINVLINQEGCSEPIPVFTANEEIIDMDFVEARLASGQGRKLNKSMDAAFVSNSGTLVDNEIVLVEFRFNYLNLKNLKKQDLFGKLHGSTNAINSVGNIHSKYYFIFESNLKQQAIRRFRNMVPSMPNNFIATDIRSLKSMFF